jgi:polysaccharide biosynthesis protein PslH
MKVLFLTQILPYPLVGGAKIRAYYMLRQLAQAHEVTLVSFVRDDDRPQDVAHLAQFCAAVHTVPMVRSRWRDGRSLLTSWLTGQPAVIIRDEIRAMQSLLQRLVAAETFDIVHADQTAMAQYGLQVKENGRVPYALLDQHNAMYKLVERQARQERTVWQRRLWQREAALLRRYETGLLHRFDAVLTVTAADRERLLALLSSDRRSEVAARITAIPICVDPAAQPLVAWDNPGPQILHLGTMFWPPNVEGVLWFVEEILPLIVAQVPEARFVIAGKNPPAGITDLTNAGSPYRAHVEVTGFVLDPLPLLSQSRVFVVPLRAGGGMRVKVVDAWQWGLPIVSTGIGAEGIETRPGENILLADEPAAFAAAVVTLLQDAAARKRLRKNGRVWVETHYNWRTVYPQIETIYKRITRNGKRKTGNG